MAIHGRRACPHDGAGKSGSLRRWRRWWRGNRRRRRQYNRSGNSRWHLHLHRRSHRKSFRDADCTGYLHRDRAIASNRWEGLSLKGTGFGPVYQFLDRSGELALEGGLISNDASRRQPAVDNKRGGKRILPLPPLFLQAQRRRGTTSPTHPVPDSDPAHSPVAHPAPRIAAW
jgi:hypothetical protein